MSDTGRSVWMFICGLTVGAVLTAVYTREPTWAKNPSVFAARQFLRCMKAPKDLAGYQQWVAEDRNRRAARCSDESLSPFAENDAHQAK